VTDDKSEFCCDEEELTVRAPLGGAAEPSIACDRWLYKDRHCIVTLNPDQLSRGHAVAILRQHRTDIADEALSGDDHGRLLTVIQRVARMMKHQLPCERVYVATLCDVVQHLHYHLVPRYATDVKGFGFLGQRETGSRTGYRVGPTRLDERVEYLESLARSLRRALD
jgi:diadenosine tetraphosphate (Ap4A) HIT family hydrolase